MARSARGEVDLVSFPSLGNAQRELPDTYRAEAMDLETLMAFTVATESVRSHRRLS